MYHPNSTEPIECARGMVYPTREDTLVHGEYVISCYMKVSIDRVVKDYESVRLPIPIKEYHYNTLKEVIGTFIQWPLMKMCRITKVHV